MSNGPGRPSVSARAKFGRIAVANPDAGAVATSDCGGKVRRVGSRTLVTYFSRFGNTRVIAALIHRKLGTDLFEIQPASAFSEDYLATVEQAKQVRDSRSEHALKAKVSNMADHDTVFLISLMTTIGMTDRRGAHDWKRRGERLVRASGLPYAVVRRSSVIPRYMT